MTTHDTKVSSGDLMEGKMREKLKTWKKEIASLKGYC